MFENDHPPCWPAITFDAKKQVDVLIEGANFTRKTRDIPVLTHGCRW